MPRLQMLRRGDHRVAMAAEIVRAAALAAAAPFVGLAFITLLPFGGLPVLAAIAARAAVDAVRRAAAERSRRTGCARPTCAQTA